MKRRSQPSTTRSRWTSALVIVLLAFSSGCAGAPPEVPAPDKEAAVESPREAPTFGGPLFDDVAANANLFAADTRIVVVVRADNAIAPT